MALHAVAGTDRASLAGRIAGIANDLELRATAERARQQAERDDATDPAAAAAAAVLGVPIEEVIAVRDTEHGPVITTHDRQTYIVVPPDRPDGAGRTGLMFAVWPQGKRRQDFPCFTPAPDDAA